MVEIKEYDCNPEEKYNIGGEIDEGGFGRVYMAFHRDSDTIVAIKYITANPRAPARWLQREIDFLKEMNHENVVSLLEVYRPRDHTYLVFEYMDNTLEDFIEAKISRKFKKVLLYQILTGVAYCHSQSIVHRDLKPKNLLFKRETCTLKLADFGHSRRVDFIGNMTPQVGSLRYNSPEMLYEHRDYSTAVDIWSVGCIFAEMASHQALFKPLEFTEDSQLDAISSVLGTPNDTNWPGISTLEPWVRELPQILPPDLGSHVPGLEGAGLDLLSKMICWDPNQRITALDALKHDYFEGVDVEITAMRALPDVFQD